MRPPPHPSAWKRLLSWCRRHPLWTAVIIIAIVIVGSVSNATSQSPATTQTSITPTATVAQAQDTPAQVQPTDTLTAIPTATPTAKPTPTPKPRAIPTLASTPKPSPIVYHPTPTPRPIVPTPCPGVNCNPWGYNFSPGNLIYAPPSNFCDYFNCIPSFWESTNGYVDECNDGIFSHSGGRRGACSYHGGELRPLYSH